MQRWMCSSESYSQELLARVHLYEYQKIAEEMRVLEMDTSKMNPVNARIVAAQQARIQAKYPTDEE